MTVKLTPANKYEAENPSFIVRWSSEERMFSLRTVLEDGYKDSRIYINIDFLDDLISLLKEFRDAAKADL